VGRHGLACFVTGTAISLAGDTLLRTLAHWHTPWVPDAWLHFGSGLTVDLGAIAAMMGAAAFYAARAHASRAARHPASSAALAAVRRR
jgi:hypothetical protein